MISRNNVADEDVLGVGITIPGIFDNDNKTMVFSPTMGIHNYPIAELTKAIPYTAVQPILQGQMRMRNSGLTENLRI